MNEFTTTILKTIVGEEGANQINELFNLSDEAFEANEEKFKKLYDSVFSSDSYQKNILQMIKLNPIENIEEEKATIEEFKDIVKEDDDLSEKKKELLLYILDKSVVATTKMAEVARERVEVEVVKMDENVKLPKYAHLTDGGADIYANDEVIIEGGETKIVPTGLKMAIPVGYMINIYPRSGLSLKTNLRIANAPGTIDTEYRSEVGVIVTNIGNDPITINKYDRIAQMVIMPVPLIEWKEVETLDETSRGEGGYGSSGK